MGGTGPRRGAKGGNKADGSRSGPAPDAAKRTGARPPGSTGPKDGGSDGKLYGGIAVLVAGLASLVWWSLPGERPAAVEDARGFEDAAATASSEGGASAKARLVRPPRASAELAVLTNKTDDLVRSIATAAEIGKRLDVRHCGGACEAVKRFMADADSFEIDILKADDLLLPPKDTMDTVAVGLTPSERESIHDRKTAVVIRTQGDTAPEQMPARAAFAAAAVLAESLDGFVYDEVARRIETVHEVVAHTVTASLGEPAFRRRHIVIQLYRQDEGTARLLTLGMARFGSPDLSIRGANMASGPVLADVINAVASKIAHGTSDAKITVTLEDVARVVGKKPSDLHASPETARPVELDIVEPQRQEGDPDNDLAELVPAGGSTREAWDVVVASLFGIPPSVGAAVDDKELADVAKKAQRELPAAIKRFEAGEGELYVKGPFAIPPESRVDGGASTEMLWIAAASCNAQACIGVLSNDPTYATNIALGKTVSVKHAEAADWMLQLKDGGAAGGESIKALKARVTR